MYLKCWQGNKQRQIEFFRQAESKSSSLVTYFTRNAKNKTKQNKKNKNNCVTRRKQMKESLLVMLYIVQVMDKPLNKLVEKV